MTPPAPLSLPSPARLRRAPDGGAKALARRFGDVLRVGDGVAAERVIEDALASGMAPAAIHALVIAPAMVRIGELWEARVITVAEEHLATSVTQRGLIRLFENQSTGGVLARSRERVLLAAVQGQRHVLGLRMVADVLEAEGFDVLYLGEDVPVDSLRGFLLQHRPAVVGLTMGLHGDARSLANALWTIHDADPEIRIMLGGRAVPAALWGVGYPRVASSLEVVEAVEDVLAGPPQPWPSAVDLLRADATASGSAGDPGESDPMAAMLARAVDDVAEVARDHVRRAETYRDMAFRDPLTDLANRRAFEDALRSLTEAPADVDGAILTIDVDAFKAVNDQRGHAAGDRVLRATGHAIRSVVRPGDLPARIGGDEFAVLLPRTAVAVAADVGDRIRAAVSAGTEPPVSISVGVAPLSDDPRAALLAADTALYEAKAGGRDRVIGARGLTA